MFYKHVKIRIFGVNTYKNKGFNTVLVQCKMNPFLNMKRCV